MKQISAVKSFFAWLAVVLALAAGIPTAARAQNHTCPTAAAGDSSNKCASTAFVQTAVGTSAITALTGDGTATGPGAVPFVLTTVNANVGSFGSATQCNTITVNAKGLITAASAVNCAPTLSQLPQGIANSIWINPTNSSAGMQNLAIPACANDGSHALVYVNGTGLQCASTLLISSRAAAAAQNLSALSVVQTLGYAAGGDGGGATFKNAGSAPFADSFVLTGTISGNGTSGCTNGSYLYVFPSGGTGKNLILNYTVSGNVVTAVAIAYTGGNGYSVGDVVSTTITGCSTTVTWTIATISTPLGSFTDSAGTHWQIVVDQGNMVNIRQFGAVQNWLGTDGSATNDFASIQAALNFAAALTSNGIDSGGSQGSTVFVPHGVSLLCGSSTPLMVPYEVKLKGQNHGSSTLKVCDSGWSSATNIINICDPTVQTSCFGSQISDLTIFENTTPASAANIAVIFSNNIQQSNVLQRVWIYAGNRSCINFQTGYGGAAMVYIDQVECTIGGTNPGINLNFGTTVVPITNSNVEAGGAGVTATGINIVGGIINIDGLHTEGISTGISVNITSLAGGGADIKHISGGVHCTNLVVLQNSNTSNNSTVAYAYPNGCTTTVLDGQTGGTSVTGVITQPKAFNP